jgi:hypothetical protein
MQPADDDQEEDFHSSGGPSRPRSSIGVVLRLNEVGDKEQGTFVAELGGVGRLVSSRAGVPLLSVI